jgi:hypothetical protein
MNKLKYFNITVMISMVLVLLVGCGKKVEQVPASASKGNSASENKPASNVINNDGIKPVETNPIETTMNIDLQKKLDTFFSNFSEAYVKPFEKGKIDDSSLISFGVIHVIINNNKLISYKGENKNEGYIKAEDVDTMTSYYFGKKVNQHKTVDNYIFEKGSYKIKMASGEAYTFSQIDKLYDLGNNKYKADVSVYKASSGFTGDSHGSINDWKAKGEEVPELSNKVTTIIEKINENGKERYILIEYKYN